jgi:hypothetical protein
MGAQVRQAGERLVGSRLVAAGDPPQRGRRGRDALEPLVATAHVVAVRGAVDVGVQVLVGAPDGQIDDHPRVAGLVGPAQVARFVAPDEPRRLVGEPVDPVQRGDELPYAGRVDREAQAGEVDLGELRDRLLDLEREGPARI